MQEALNRWARRHERVFLTAFLGVCLPVLALIVLAGFRDGGDAVRVAIVAVGAAGLLGSVAHQVVLWRRGDLILRDKKARERNRTRIEKVGKPLGYALGGAAVAAGAVLGEVETILATLFGSVMLGYTPVLMWIAHVYLPAEKRREAAESRPT
jgi:hypothetical protein